MKEKLTIKQLLAILSAGLFNFCGVVIETATNITFPTLMEEFNVSTSTVQWMTTGNLLMLGIFIPISSYLKRRYKTKKIFLVASILFITGLILDIISMSFPLLLLGRLIQGAGVGIALPMMYNIILDESPKSMIGAMMGFGSFITGCAPAIGPTLGGLMTQYLNWRFIFIVALPIVIFAMITGVICISDNNIDTNEKLDIISFISISIAFIFLMLGFSNLDKIISKTLLVILYFIIGLISLICFVYRQKHINTPLICLDIFNNKKYTFHTIAIMCLQMTTLGLGLLLPSYIQIVLNKDASAGGLALLPGAIITAVFSFVGGILLDKYGAKKPIISGAICGFLGVISFIVLFKHLSYSLIIIFYFIYSIGVGLLVGNTMTSALSNISQRLQPDGNASLQTLMQLSGGIGTSISGAILAFFQIDNLVNGTREGSLFVFIYLTITITIVLISQSIALKEES